MEPSSFDDQIFGDFAGPLSPLGAKPLNQQSSHSVQVMLGISQSNSADMCTQRLPEVHSLLPGSPKIDHYKNLDYASNKIDYTNKMGSYSPTNKYDYVNGKIDQYSPSSKLDYSKPMDYNSSSKLEFSTNSNKLEYDHHIQMFQQPSQTMESQALNGKKKTDESSSNSTAPVSGTASSDPSNSNAAKKTEKKKGDPNGIKKKKTRYGLILKYI